jgi:hypothetical protein
MNLTEESIIKEFRERYTKPLYEGSLEELADPKVIFVPQNIWIENFLLSSIRTAKREVLEEVKRQVQDEETSHGNSLAYIFDRLQEEEKSHE